MSINSRTQAHQEAFQELVELNDDDLNVIVGGQGSQYLHGQIDQTRTIKFCELDKFTRQTNNGYEVGTRSISFDALETVTSDDV
ncbi:hypothetical protein NIES2101_17850 [Calothrix sp. HK-06]|nr:hypothetical protein NIES2101_17850 [Calothrix sp. HK-06]